MFTEREIITGLSLLILILTVFGERFGLGIYWLLVVGCAVALAILTDNNWYRTGVVVYALYAAYRIWMPHGGSGKGNVL